jgi:hypothetical protein
VFDLLFSAAFHPAWPGAPDWLSTRVLVCGIGAIGLAILALVLKGVQKAITLTIALLVVLGGVWFVQDAWAVRAEILPPELAAELNGAAGRALENPDAKAVWKSLQAEWSRWDKQARNRLAAGGDDARAAIRRRLETKAAELRRQGKKAAAEEVTRFGEKVAPRE